MRWAVALVLMSTVASAGERAALLVSETLPDGTSVFWWACGERHETAVADRLTPQLERLGLAILDRCDGLPAPIHKSYRHADLKDHDVINLGNALGVGRIIAGSARFVTKAPLDDLGLVHVEGTLTLVPWDLDTEKAGAKVEVTADGFDHDPTRAWQRAGDILLARIAPSLPVLAERPKAAPVATLHVRVDKLARPVDLDGVLKSLAAVPGVQHVTMLELTKSGALLAVEPPDARAAVEAFVKAPSSTVRLELAP